MHITSRPGEDFEKKIELLLRLLRVHLKLEIAIVSHVKDARYEIFALDAPGSSLHKHRHFPLHATYCERTLAMRQVTSFHHAALDDTWLHHPAYEAFALESYIGAAIFVNEVCFGTLNFSSPRPRDTPFTSHDHDLMEFTAHWLGRELLHVQKEARARHDTLLLKQSVASARDHALRANALQQHMIRRIFQELHMPLHGIASLSMQVAQQRKRVDGPNHRRAEAIHATSTHLLTVLTDVLDTSSLTEGTPRASRFSLHTIIEEVATLLAPLAHQRKLYLDICLDAMLPDEVRGDPLRLRQILMNLLGDAVKRTQQGGVYMRCALDNSQPDDEQAILQITIQDTSKSTHDLLMFGDTLADEVPPGVEIARHLIAMMDGEFTIRDLSGSDRDLVLRLPLLLTEGSVMLPQEPSHAVWLSCTHAPLHESLKTSCARHLATVVASPELAQICLIDGTQHDAQEIITACRTRSPESHIYLVAEPAQQDVYAGARVDGMIDTPLRQRQLADVLGQQLVPRHIPQQLLMTTTLSMELHVDDLALGEWLLPPSFDDLELSWPTSPHGDRGLAGLSITSTHAEDSTAIGVLGMMRSVHSSTKLPILDTSIHESLHDDTHFFYELTHEFFTLGAQLIDHMREHAQDPSMRGAIASDVQEMLPTAQCLGLLRVSAQCQEMNETLSTSSLGAIASHIERLAALLDEAFEATHAWRQMGQLTG